MLSVASLFSPQPIRKIGFETLLARHTTTILLNTLPESNQSCLIAGTIECADEEIRLNEAIQQGTVSYLEIIVYGMHACDPTPETKYAQLRALGFSRVSIYPGGLFEYLLLQDVFGATTFPTRGRELDILRYRPTLK